MLRPCQDVQRLFRDVPPGSTVEVSVDGPPGACTVVWTLLGPGPDPTGTISCPGRAAAGEVSVANATYVVVFDMQFNEDATVAIGIELSSRAPVRCTVSGEAGDRFKWLWPILTA